MMTSDKRAIRILHVIDSFGAGGAQQIVLDLLGAWPRAGWEMEAVALHGREPYGPRMEDAGIRTHVLAGSRRQVPAILLGLNRLFRHGSFDVVHSHLSASNILSCLLCPPPPRGPFLVLHDHSGDGHHGERFGGLLRMAERRLWSRADRVVCISRQVRDVNVKDRRMDPGKLALIPNAADVDRFPGDRRAGRTLLESLGLPAGVFVIGGVGRLVGAKGFDVLIRAFARSCGSGDSAAGKQPVWLVLVGDGVARGELEALAESCGVAGRTLFVGFQSAIPDLTAALDLFVFPSRIEPFGIVGLEALASRLPVIATRVGGIPDFMTDRDNGLLVDSDNVDQLVEALKFALTHPDEMIAMAERGDRLVRAEYSIQRIVARVIEMYRDLLAVAGRPIPIETLSSGD